MNLQLLEEMLQNGESSSVEFKIAPPRAAELAERLAGLANANGGYLVIGVQDQTWEVVGVPKPSEAVDHILQAARLCRPTVRFDPPQPEVVELRGKKLVVAHISPNDGTLYQAGGVYWMRRGTHTVALELQELKEFLYNGGLLDWETRPVEMATMADLNMNLVETCLERRTGRSRLAGQTANLNDILVKLRCAAWSKAENGQDVLHPTNAGLLLFGYAPQDFLLDAEVVCVLYPDNLGLRRYVDRRNVRGPLTEQIDQVEKFFRQNMRVAGRMEGFHRVDEPDYPMEALREAVVNAVVHRDYGLRGEKVRIFYYEDRIEIHSPGLLMPGIKLDDLRQGVSRSKPRNPVLATLLHEFPGGYMEQIGSGVSFMLNSMRQLGRPDPDFKEQGEFVVTFRRSLDSVSTGAPAFPAPQPVITGPAPEIARTSPLAAAPVGQEAEENLLSQRKRLELALQYIHKYGSITNGEYRELTGASETTARRDFDLLIEQGSIRAVGSKRGRKYVL